MSLLTTIVSKLNISIRRSTKIADIKIKQMPFERQPPKYRDAKMFQFTVLHMIGFRLDVDAIYTLFID